MANPVDVFVGNKLREFREARGLSQKAVAAASEISFQQVQKYETGANRLSASRMWQFGGILGFAPSDLFEGLDDSDHRKTPRQDGRSARQRNDLIKAFGEIEASDARRAVVTTAKLLARAGA